MISNIQIFSLSIKNKESYIDEYYVKDSKPIITDNPKKLNNLMKSNVEICDNIAAYKIAIKSKNKKMQNIILENIVKILKTSGINNTEFTSYWALKDMSYSAYKTFNSNHFIQIEFLKNVIPEFIKDRHLLYKIHGYSFSSLQAIKDSKAHKGNGNAANKKIINILNQFGFSYFSSKNIDEFIKSNHIYICPDKADKILFEKILKHFKLKFKWSKNKQKKQTDFLIKINDHILIMEHKHMKESGGGQDKQMSEIIDFISHQDKDVHYISFLDGIYFNLLANEAIKSGKPFEQRKNILQNLKKNKNNYFVNTYGFIELLKVFIKNTS